MRFLIVDHYYDPVINWIYGRQPGLDRASYTTQRTRIDDALFGQTSFEVAALRELGHDAWDCLVNIRPLQEGWARENDARLSPAVRWGLSRRRRWIPWPRRGDGRWMAEALLAQVRKLKPDVVHIQSMDLLHPEIVAAVRRETRLVVGQIAADLPAWDYGCYDLVVSSVPDLVQRFRRDGGDSEWLPLAFEPSLAERLPKVERDVPVSFVGSFSVSHPKRIEVVEAVARVAPLHTWTGDVEALPAGSPVRPTIQGVAWGRDMYEVLNRSRLTINNHARIAGTAANNLRLFEATGMGALLITDAGSNLGDLFEVGREAVTYRDPQECGEVVRHYLDHPREAEEIAAAGQRRTLRDHTWHDRMERLVEMVRLRI
jgi:spore maturation protein CgeB